MSISDVKKKWHCLRTAYANELKREKQSFLNHSRFPFKSNLFYFKDMEFITEHIVFRKNVINKLSYVDFVDDSGTETYNSLSPKSFSNPAIPDIENLGALEEIYPELDNFLEKEFDNMSGIENMDRERDTAQSIVTDAEPDNIQGSLISKSGEIDDPCEERGSPKRSPKLLLYHPTEARKKKDYDEFEFFAISLASQMRKMEFEDAMTVMAQIQQIVSTKRIERDRKRFVFVFKLSSIQIMQYLSADHLMLLISLP